MRDADADDPPGGEPRGARQDGHGAAPIVRIGCVPHLPLQQLQAFLGALYLRSPAVTTDVLHLRSMEQLQRVRAGELDIALVDDAPGVHDGIVAEALYPGERMVAFLPPAHRLAAKPILAPDDLQDEVLLTLPRRSDEAVHDHLLAMLREAGYGFRGVRETGFADLRDVLVAVAEGRGVALAPASTPQAVGALSRIVERRQLNPPAWMPDIMAARAAATTNSDGGLGELVRDVARELYPSTGAARSFSGLSERFAGLLGDTETELRRSADLAEDRAERAERRGDDATAEAERGHAQRAREAAQRVAEHRREWPSAKERDRQ